MHRKWIARAEVLRLVEKRSVGQPRSDDKNVDAVAAEFHLCRAAEALQGEFAGHVGAAERHSAEAVDRRHLDNQPSASLYHVGRDSREDVERPEEVRLEDAAQVFGLHLGGQAGHANPRTISEDVDATELVNGVSDNTLYLLRDSNISNGNGTRTWQGSKFLPGRLETGAIPRDESDVSPFPGKLGGERLANSTGGADYQHNFVVESQGNSPRQMSKPHFGFRCKTELCTMGLLGRSD